MTARPLEPGIRRRAMLVGLAVAIAGCGGGEPSESGEAEPASDEPAAAETGAAGADPTIELYFTSGEQFRKVERPVPQRGSKLRAAAEALIEGPSRREAAAEVEAQTQIPGKVRVERVTVENGTAVVEVSKEFTEGIPAAPERRTRAQRSELSARLGQLTYTLTQFEGVRETKVVAGGATVQAPLAREDYAKPRQGPQRVERPRGAKGPAVRELQQRLAQLRFLPRRAVDGVDGYRTRQAVIAFQSWRGLERDGIVGPATTAALARASRPRPKGRGPAHRIEVYREKGVALLVENGRTKRAIHVSTGAPATPTPAGTYEVFRKELRSWSVPFSTWLPWASYFNQGIAFHEYPDVPVYPASHGCVRVPAPEAEYVYEFAELGTTVVVI
jgi:lipoprotein-anchoring transpeptidase ErfK/SrfK